MLNVRTRMPRKKHFIGGPLRLLGELVMEIRIVGNARLVGLRINLQQHCYDRMVLAPRGASSH